MFWVEELWINVFRVQEVATDDEDFRRDITVVELGSSYSL